MKVVVCLKRIPAPDGNIRLADDGLSLDCSLVESILNPFDEYALEAALRVRETFPPSSLLAVSVGDRAGENQLRLALAVGADDALLIEAPDAPVARAALWTAAALRDGAPDLVFCGRQALDDQMGFFPAALAEWLGYAHVSGVLAVDCSGGTGRTVCRRRGDGGEQEVVLSGPAVIACDRMVHELRAPALKNRLAAKKRAIRVVPPTDSGVKARVPVRLRVGPVPERAPRKVWSPATGSTAGELLAILRQEEGLGR